MLYSFKELKKQANLLPSTTLEDVCKAINTIGFEVEKTTKFGDVSGIKFGKVLETSKNPNSEKLFVCKIAFDDMERIIQTTADNVVVGMYVIAFVPGSKMGDITIEAKEMGQIVSEGMLTSINELGAPKELLRDGAIDGIQSYSEVDLKIDPVDHLDLQDDIIDVDVLSNRSDANSYIIMAKELAAYFGTKPKKLIVKKSSFNSKLKVENGVSESLVILEAKNNFEITMQEQILLMKGGIKSIDNLVDLTNLTFIMTGQPTHAYDKEKVGLNLKASLGSGKVTIFGGKEVELDNNLVIESNNKIVSLAGVMGLDQTGVNKETKEFIIELGKFNIKQIRNTLKTIKISSLSGVQSSKNLGAGTIELANMYLSSKLNTFSNSLNFKPAKSLEIKFDEKEVSKLAGFDITKTSKYKKVIKSLETLDFEFLDSKILIPSYRHDISHQQDINEEIFRFYGYDNFKPEAPRSAPAKVVTSNSIGSIIAGQGYSEVTTYSLISKKRNIINPFKFKKSVELETFISKEREVIRDSQATSLLELIDYNQKRKINDLSLFSIGMINNGIKTIALTSTIKTFSEIKQDITNLINGPITFVRLENESLHPGVSASIMLNNKVIGWIGKVHPSITNIDAFIAEFKMIDNAQKNTFTNYSQEPLKSRDFTFELKEKEELVSKLPKKDIFSIKVIDKFVKDGINKVTVRIVADGEIIKLIDEELNK